MRIGRLQRAGVALLILIAVFALGSAGAAASGFRPKPLSAREASAFWTPQRMRAAEPLEVGRSHTGSPPPLARSASTFGEDFEEVADPTTPEFRVHGAIFLSFGIFGYARCSGTAVRSRNESVVITAGHCLNSGGRHSHWFSGPSVFVPAYRFGQRPFGVFPARWIDTTRQWRAVDSENVDVGALVVGRNAAGKLLGEAVGGAGIAFNRKPDQVFDVHGYPAEIPFDGETQRICRGTRFLGHDTISFVYPGPLNLGVECDLTGGASGGGWTIAGGVLNSVTDYGYFDRGSPAYGSYFGKEVQRLFGRAERR